MVKWVKADQEACDRVLTGWDALTQSLMGSSEVRMHIPTETMSTTLYCRPAAERHRTPRVWKCSTQQLLTPEWELPPMLPRRAIPSRLVWGTRGWGQRKTAGPSLLLLFAHSPSKIYWFTDGVGNGTQGLKWPTQVLPQSYILSPNQPSLEASWMSRPMLDMISNKERKQSKGLETRGWGERVYDRQEGKGHRKVHYCLPVPLLCLCWARLGEGRWEQTQMSKRRHGERSEFFVLILFKPLLINLHNLHGISKECKNVGGAEG